MIRNTFRMDHVVIGRLDRQENHKKVASSTLKKSVFFLSRIYLTFGKNLLGDLRGPKITASSVEFGRVRSENASKMSLEGSDGCF